MTAKTPSLIPVLTLTFLCSMGTGVFWNGISFIADHQYDFTQNRTLILYILMGLVYTVGAFTSGRVVRRVRPFVAPRTLLGGVIGAQAILCIMPVLIGSEWVLWAVSLLVNYAASMLWPLVESYLTAGRHGHDMRSAIGWFNFVWTTAVTLAMLLMAFVLE
ncbi:MAG: putative MFS family arabinose efflux permease, partial [Planctomycetota bacterium]